jgi:phage gp29-like protein
MASAIDRIQRELARIIGTEVLMMGDSGGNRALSQDKSRNLYLIANSVLGNIASGFDKDIIGPLWDLNAFPKDKQPKFTVEDVAFKDAQECTAALREMATAGAVLAPNDPAINEVRDLLGLPHQPEPTPEMISALSAEEPAETDEEAADAVEPDEEAADAVEPDEEGDDKKVVAKRHRLNGKSRFVEDGEGLEIISQ